MAVVGSYNNIAFARKLKGIQKPSNRLQIFATDEYATLVGLVWENGAILTVGHINQPLRLRHTRAFRVDLPLDISFLENDV